MEGKIALCRRCGHRLEIETNKDLAKEYKYFCPVCDENFYEFEANYAEKQEGIGFDKAKLFLSLVNEAFKGLVKLNTESSSVRAACLGECKSARGFLEGKYEVERRYSGFVFDRLREALNDAFDWYINASLSQLGISDEYIEAVDEAYAYYSFVELDRPRGCGTLNGASVLYEGYKGVDFVEISFTAETCGSDEMSKDLETAVKKVYQAIKEKEGLL